MPGWIRRNPWIAAGIGLPLGFFFLGALMSDDPVSTVLGLVVLCLFLALIVWVGWLVLQSWRRIRRRWRHDTVDPIVVRPTEPTSVSTQPIAPQANSVSAPLVTPVRAPALGDVLSLTPGQFEDLTVGLLASIGYQSVRRTGGSGDLGADIVCRDQQGRSTIVQCKRYAPGSTIGTPVIQTFIGMMQVHHRADRGVFVTTVGFSQPAVDLARQHGIALIDGGSLLLLLHLTGTPLFSPPTQSISG
jgi:restriction endonuclease Mrr